MKFKVQWFRRLTALPRLIAFIGNIACVGPMVTMVIGYINKVTTWGILSSFCRCDSEALHTGDNGVLERCTNKTDIPQAFSLLIEAQLIVRRLRIDAGIGNRNGRLFVGPSSTGKTELLRSIAKYALQQGLRVVWLSILPNPSDMPHRSIFSKLFGCTGGLEAYRTMRHRYPSAPTSVLYSHLLQLQTEVALPGAFATHPRSVVRAGHGAAGMAEGRVWPGRVVVVLDDIHNCFLTAEGIEIIQEVQMLLHHWSDQCWVVAAGNESAPGLCYAQMPLKQGQKQGYAGYERLIDLNYTKLVPRFLKSGVHVNH